MVAAGGDGIKVRVWEIRVRGLEMRVEMEFYLRIKLELRKMKERGFQRIKVGVHRNPLLFFHIFKILLTCFLLFHIPKISFTSFLFFHIPKIPFSTRCP